MQRITHLGFQGNSGSMSAYLMSLATLPAP